MNTFLLSLLVSLSLTLIIIKITKKFNWVYKPQSNRWNSNTVSLHGGVAMGLSFLIVSLIHFNFQLTTKESFIVVISMVMMTLGLVDDTYPIRPFVKLTFNLLVSAGAIYFNLYFHIFEYEILNYLITAFWITGITNAINLLDNMDGATTSVLLVIMVFIAVIMHSVSELASTLALICIGVLIGFLTFNFNPAKIFMGDSGSLFLGTLTSLILIEFHLNLPNDTSFLHIPLDFIYPILVIIVPIIDTSFVTINRLLNGYPVSLGDKGHITHRLSYIFKSDKISVLILCCYQAIVCILVYYNYFYLLTITLVGTVLILMFITKRTNHYVWPNSSK